MMSMTDLVAIGVEPPRIDSGCSLEKEFIKFIYMNLLIVLYLIINQVNTCHTCVHGPLTWETKDILWMNDQVLTMSY